MRYLLTHYCQHVGTKIIDVLWHDLPPANLPYHFTLKYPDGKAAFRGVASEQRDFPLETLKETYGVDTIIFWGKP